MFRPESFTGFVPMRVILQVSLQSAVRRSKDGSSNTARLGFRTMKKLDPVKSTIYQLINNYWLCVTV